MALKKLSIKKYLFPLSLVLAFLLLLFIIASLVLPSIVENRIRQELSDNFGLNNFQIAVKKIGISNILASAISTGDTIAVDTIEIDYSIKSLFNKELNYIRISGLTIKINMDKNFKIGFSDFDIEKFKAIGKTKEDNKTIDIASLPFLPKKIELLNSKIIFALPSFEIPIPFQAMSSINSRENKIKTDIALMPFGEKINAGISLDPGRKSADIKLKTKSFDLCRLVQPLEYFSPGINLPAGTSLNIETDILIDKDRLKALGNFTALNPTIPAIPMEYDLDLDLLHNNTFAFKIFNCPSGPVKVVHNNQNMTLTGLRTFFNLAGTPLKASGSCSVFIKQSETQLENGKILAENINIKSRIDYDLTRPGRKINSKTHAGIYNISVETGKHKINIAGVKARLPFTISNKPLEQVNHGKFTIKKCTLDDKYQCRIKGNLSRIKSDLLIKGNVILPDIKNLILGFDTKLSLGTEDSETVKLNFYSKPYAFTLKKVAKFIPQQAKGINFTANLSSAGRIEYSPEKVKSYLKIEMNKGSLKIPDSDLDMEGISTTLEFCDLINLRSMPAQVLSIDSIRLGDINMTSAKIKYNIESASSVFIENTKIKWCNGIVSSEAFRIPDKDNNYSLILYCDRLELTGILEQLGAFHAEGSGTLSGRIPVTYNNGKIAFNNGFLFSSPGKGGKIIVDNADKLTQGIPMDTPQFSQLDLAKEALKNYNYKWAKLNLNTADDTLLVHMQFDGQPSNQVLPFEYKKELGRFVRVDAASRGSHFQGIKLDVNLKLPFNQVLKFGNKLKQGFK